MWVSFRRFLLIVVIAFVGTILLLPSYTPSPVAPQPPQSSDPLALAIRAARESYVPLTNRDDLLRPVSEGTGVRLTDNIVLSCFHTLQASATLYSGTEPVQFKAAIPQIDLALFQVSASHPFKVKLAREAILGEQLVSYSNAGGEDGMLRFYRITKITDRFILLDQASIPGESGAGLFNVRGELVGVVDQVKLIRANHVFAVGYGAALSTNTIRRFIEDPFH